MLSPCFAADKVSIREMLAPLITLKAESLLQTFSFDYTKSQSRLPVFFTKDEFEILRNYWRDAFSVDMQTLSRDYPALAHKLANDSMFLKFGAGCLIPEFRTILAKEEFWKIGFVKHTRGLIVQFRTENQCYYLKPYQDSIEKKIIDKVREIGIVQPFIIKWGEYFVEDETGDANLTDLARSGLLSPSQIGEIVGTVQGELDDSGIVYIDKLFPGNIYTSHIYLNFSAGDIKVIDFGNSFIDSWMWKPVSVEEGADMERIMQNMLMLSPEMIKRFAFYDLEDRNFNAALLEIKIFYSAKGHFDERIIIKETEEYTQAKLAFEQAYQYARMGKKKVKDLEFMINDTADLIPRTVSSIAQTSLMEQSI